MSCSLVKKKGRPEERPWLVRQTSKLPLGYGQSGPSFPSLGNECN
jgi:hypothetical protein